MAIIRPILGISPSAWEEARTVMGEIPAAIVIACILQRVEAISSPGGYLRALPAKAAAGAFSVGPMLMALGASRQREGRQRA